MDFDLLKQNEEVFKLFLVPRLWQDRKKKSLLMDFDVRCNSSKPISHVFWVIIQIIIFSFWFPIKIFIASFFFSMCVVDWNLLKV